MSHSPLTHPLNDHSTVPEFEIVEFEEECYTANYIVKEEIIEPVSSPSTAPEHHSIEHNVESICAAKKKGLEEDKIKGKWQCDSCSYTTPLKCRLRIHSTVHLEIRSFPCPVCDKAFKSSVGLKQHSVVHIDGRPFQCCHCKKNYKRRNELKVHYNTVHPSLPCPLSSRKRYNQRQLECAV